ncbi:hypothetical protein Rsub_12451, partial [Raphidocelis subcapitata]
TAAEAAEAAQLLLQPAARPRRSIAVWLQLAIIMARAAAATVAMALTLPCSWGAVACDSGDAGVGAGGGSAAAGGSAPGGGSSTAAGGAVRGEVSSSRRSYTYVRTSAAGSEESCRHQLREGWRLARDDKGGRSKSAAPVAGAVVVPVESDSAVARQVAALLGKPDSWAALILIASRDTKPLGKTREARSFFQAVERAIPRPQQAGAPPAPPQPFWMVLPDDQAAGAVVVIDGGSEAGVDAWTVPTDHSGILLHYEAPGSAVGPTRHEVWAAVGQPPHVHASRVGGKSRGEALMWSNGTRACANSNGKVGRYSNKAKTWPEARRAAWLVVAATLAAGLHAMLVATMAPLVMFASAVMRCGDLASTTLQGGVHFQQIHGTVNSGVRAHKDGRDLWGSFILWKAFPAAAEEAAAAAASSSHAGTTPWGWFMLWELGLAVPARDGAHLWLRTAEVYHGTLFPNLARPQRATDAFLAGFALCNKRDLTTTAIGQLEAGDVTWEGPLNH